MKAPRRLRRPTWRRPFYPKRMPTRYTRCLTMPRPCPFFSCPQNLYLEVNPETGAVKRRFPRVPLAKMAQTCGLDVLSGFVPAARVRKAALP
jgi:hypothetical protein